MLGLLLGVSHGGLPFTQPVLQPKPFTQFTRAEPGFLLDASGEPAVFKKPECLRDAKIVFVAIENKSSTIMRGWMTTSVMQRAYGQDSSVVLLDQAHGSKERLKTIQDHFVDNGSPTVCVILKWPTLEAISACRHQGALVLLDCIDNPECANRDFLAREEFKRVDALLVQTKAHQKALQGLGMHAGVWPHPHGNFMRWAPSGPRRERIRNVGFVVGDPVHNMPDNKTIQMLANVCCRHGAKLWLVLSEQAAEEGQEPPALRMVRAKTAERFGHDPVCSPEPDVNERCLPDESLEVPEPPGSEHKFSALLRTLVNQDGLESTPIVQSQRVFYQTAGEDAGEKASGDIPDGDDVPMRIEDIDLGLLWAPTQRMTTDGPFATFNRPPTRLFWWFSHGTPVIGHSMQSYIEAAEVIGYPQKLMRVDSAASLDEALCSVAGQEVRGGLQRLSRYGGSLGSPVLSAGTLLQQMCTIANELDMKLVPSPADAPEQKPKTEPELREERKLYVQEHTYATSRKERQESNLEMFFPSPLNCSSPTQCALDVPMLQGSFAATAKEMFARIDSCKQVIYTVYFDVAQNAPVNLPPPVDGARVNGTNCAFAFVYKGTVLPQRNSKVNEWSYIEVDVVDLPWPAEQYRRNSRVPKLLPHLFFPPSVKTTVYIDAENTVYGNLSSIAHHMLGRCNASWSAQAHKNRAVAVMDEFPRIKLLNNSAEPSRLSEQWRGYQQDPEYRKAANERQTVGIDGELLVRQNADRRSRLLSEAWMRTYLRGADRDQPSFSYALEKAVTGPCRRRVQEHVSALRSAGNPGIDEAKQLREQCGLGCGEGFMNLVGHAASTDCQRYRAGKVTHIPSSPPEGEADEYTRPRWSSRPPTLICKSTGLVEAAQPLLSEHMRDARNRMRELDAGQQRPYDGPMLHEGNSSHGPPQ